MPKEGFRDDPKLTKRQLQLALQKEKAKSGLLLGQLSQLGPLMEKFAKRDWQIMKLSHENWKALRLNVLALGPKQTATVKEAFRKIADAALEGALMWKKMQDPTFTEDSFMDPEQILSEEPANLGEPLAAPMKCSKCDWTGPLRDCNENLLVDGGIACPLCDEQADKAGDPAEGG